MSTAAIVKAYQEDVERKRDLIRRANGARDRLMIIVTALARLRADDVLADILGAEELASMPAKLEQRVRAHAGGDR